MVLRLLSFGEVATGSNLSLLSATTSAHPFFQEQRNSFRYGGFASNPASYRAALNLQATGQLHLTHAEMPEGSAQLVACHSRHDNALGRNAQARLLWPA